MSEQTPVPLPSAGAFGAVFSGRPLLVLHVNDSTDDQILFQAACKSARVPINWHVVETSERALSYCKRLVEQSKEITVCWPDLILLDLHLAPDREGGFEVLEYVRTRPELKHIPVVIFSAYEAARFQTKAYELGANAYLVKPHGFKQEVQMVKELYTWWNQGSPPPLPG